ncbi:MAG: Rv2175c family DNA-binding protein [Mycobacteriales bacterium]
MSETASDLPASDIDWLDADDVADALGIEPGQVARLIHEQRLTGVRRAGTWYVPAGFLDDGAIVKGLPGTITLLADAGYSGAETIDWLFTAEETLPGRPIDALRENRGREVHRRAQIAGF